MEGTIRFTLRIVQDLNQRLESKAKDMGITKHALILQVLWEYVETLQGGVENA